MKRLPLFLLLVLFLGACGAPPLDPSLPIDQQINQVVQGAGATGLDIVSSYNIGGDKTEMVDDNITDGSNNGETISIIKVDCFAFQKALWTSAVASQVSDVFARVNSRVQDQYGQRSNAMIGTCDVSSATAHHVQWSHLDEHAAWNVYDRTWLLPSLSQQVFIQRKNCYTGSQNHRDPSLQYIHMETSSLSHGQRFMDRGVSSLE